jgi:biopolymer transport protein ExbB/TolQ
VIQLLMPLILCALPLVAAGLVAAATPAPALHFYLIRVRDSHLDWIILGLGLILFTLQMILAWRALHWRGTSFDERPDRWLSNLAQAAEWFPLLGLIGTVMGILETFNQIAVNPGTGTSDIIRAYAPAITATGSGLFMALINMFPTWIVLLGRDLILTLGGRREPPAGETPP